MIDIHIQHKGNKLEFQLPRGYKFSFKSKNSVVFNTMLTSLGSNSSSSLNRIVIITKEPMGGFSKSAWTEILQPMIIKV